MAKKSKKEPQRHAVSPFVPAEEPSPVPLVVGGDPLVGSGLENQAPLPVPLTEPPPEPLPESLFEDLSQPSPLEAVETTTSGNAVEPAEQGMIDMGFKLAASPPAPFNIMTCSPEEATQMKQGLMTGSMIN